MRFAPLLLLLGACAAPAGGGGSPAWLNAEGSATLSDRIAAAKGRRPVWLEFSFLD